MSFAGERFASQSSWSKRNGAIDERLIKDDDVRRESRRLCEGGHTGRGDLDRGE
jgi:hypothetical protein